MNEGCERGELGILRRKVKVGVCEGICLGSENGKGMKPEHVEFDKGKKKGKGGQRCESGC